VVWKLEEMMEGIDLTTMFQFLIGSLEAGTLVPGVIVAENGSFNSS